MDWSKMEVKRKIRTHCQSHWPQSKSIPTRSPLLCLHNWLQAFGVCHIFWNLICKQRKAGAQSNSSRFCQNSAPTPRRPAERKPCRRNLQVEYVQLGYTWHSVLILRCTQVNFTRGAVKSSWNTGGYGVFVLMPHNFQTNSEKERQWKSLKRKIKKAVP